MSSALDGGPAGGALRETVSGLSGAINAERLATVLGATQGLTLATLRSGRRIGTGRHQRFHRGPDLEFERFRDYEPGDDPRLIDWRLYARSDRVHVRESLQPSRLRIVLLVDGGPSMQLRDRESHPSAAGRARIAVAQDLAIALQILASADADALEVRWPAEAETLRLQPTRGAGQAAAAAGIIASLESGVGRLAGGADLAGIDAGDWLIVASDGFNDALFAAAVSAASRGIEVVAIALRTADESTFPFADAMMLTGPGKLGESIVVDGPGARQGYLAALAAHDERRANELGAVGGRRLIHPLGDPLRSLLIELAGPPRA